MPIDLANVREDDRSWSGDMIDRGTTFHVEIYAVNLEGVACWETNIWEPANREMVWPEAVREARHFPTLDFAIQMAAWKIVEALKDERNVE